MLRNVFLVLVAAFAFGWFSYAFDANAADAGMPQAGIVITATPAPSGALHAPVTPPAAPLGDGFWISFVALGCGVLTAAVHRIGRNVKWMQAGIGGLASAVFCAVATAIGAAVLNVGLTRGLALVAMSAVGSAIGSFNPGPKPDDDQADGDAKRTPTLSRVSCILPWFILVGFSLALAGCPTCTPAQDDAWAKLGADAKACAAPDVAPVLDAGKQVLGNLITQNPTDYKAVGLALVTQYGATTALCILAAAWHDLGPVMFGAVPESGPHFVLDHLLNHPDAWLNPAASSDGAGIP